MNNSFYSISLCYYASLPPESNVGARLNDYLICGWKVDHALSLHHFNSH